MKKILILFITLMLYPQQGFSKAMCPVDISLEDCCSLKNEMTYDACQATCRGTCTGGYYGSCFTCNGNISIEDTCYPTQLRCESAITLPEQYCEKFGNTYCLSLTLPETATTTKTVSSCPAGGTLSADQCCCEYK